jgi:hypothetical protein
VPNSSSPVSSLVAQDIETTDDRGLTYTIVLAPTQGTLLLSSVPLSASGTFTQDDINNGRVSYLHGGAIAGNDSFVFTCKDDNHNSHPPGATDVLDGVNSDLTTNIFTINISRLNPAVAFNGPIPTFNENPGTSIIIDNDSQTVVVNQAAPAAFVVGGSGIGTMTVALSIPSPPVLPAGYPAFTDDQDVLGIKTTLGGAITATLSSAVGVQPQVFTLTYTNPSNVTFPIGVLTTGTSTVPLSVQFSSSTNIPAAAVTEVLKIISFGNPSQNPSNASRQVTVLVTNGAGYSSVPVSKAITVVPYNNPPLIALPAIPAGYTVPRVTITGAVGASDPDSIMTFAISSPPGKGTVTVANNVWTYTAFAASSGVDSFSITVGDLGIPSDLTPSPTPGHPGLPGADHASRHPCHASDHLQCADGDRGGGEPHLYAHRLVER